MKNKSEINFKITLDENHVPEKIEWEASDSEVDGMKEAKAIIISLWDKSENNTLRFDLWTKDMLLFEMKHFFFQSIITMSDTYERATSDAKIANEIREFGKMIGEKMLKNNT